jgi:hypothetical protein
MKKTLLIALLSIGTIASAQFTVNKFNGTPFTNGEIIEFTSNSDSAAELKFTVTNTSTQNLDFKIRCMDLVNATGTNFQLCWAFECIPGVALNGNYPNFQYIINAGTNTVGLGDSFKNFNPGSGTFPMDHSFRFVARDLSGNLVGSALNITYRYQGPLSIEKKDRLSLMGVKVLNTYVDSFVGLEIKEKVNYSLSNIQGQKVMSGNLESNSNLEFSALNTGIYFLTFSNNDGLSDSIKIYKK